MKTYKVEVFVNDRLEHSGEVERSNNFTLLNATTDQKEQILKEIGSEIYNWDRTTYYNIDLIAGKSGRYS